MMGENELEKLLEAIEQDERIKSIRKTISSGKAVYADAYEYAWKIGEYTTEAAKKVFDSAVAGGAEATEAAKAAIRTLLENDYAMIADATADIQKILNSQAGLGLNAVRPGLNESRTEGLIKWLFDEGGDLETIRAKIKAYSSEPVTASAKEFIQARKAAEIAESKKAALGSKIENYSGSVVTDSVEANVKFQKESGLEPHITRTLVGGCCPWCSRLAGKYEYDNRPKDIFRRHDNCRCLVLYDAGDGVKTDVWTKLDYKSEKDARDARIAREKEIAAAKANEEQHAKQKNIARDKGEKYIDATEYWQNKPKESPAKIISRNKKFDYNGEHYKVDGHHVKFEPSTDEIATAQWWAERFGGKVELLPKVGYPLGVATPDYLINGEKVDRKALSGAGKNLIDNAIRSKKEQATRFIIDVTNADISEAEIYEQTSKIMNSQHRSWVQELFVIKDGEIVQVLERP